MRHRSSHSIVWIAGLLALLPLGISAQTTVYLERSNTLSFDEERLPDAQILRGDVCFRHDSALMFCDSAYFFEKTNSLTAFSHVRIVQGDTLSAYGDVLYYDGNTRIARLRRHVRLIHRGTTLTTNSLNYDRQRNLAYYFSGGVIRDSLNTLVSQWGQYTPPTSQAVFRHDVRLDNNRFVLTADTLCYNTGSKRADLVGPTTIVYEGETTILSSLGIYHTDTEQSTLYQRSRVLHSDGQSLTGDTIYYDKRIGYGRVRGHMEAADSAQQATLYGNYGELYETDNHGYATGNALMVDRSASAAYTYIHADTLFTEQCPYPEGDSTWRRVRGHHHVRIYRTDLQAVCDSAVYIGRDSLFSLYTLPVCWSDSQQISADSIRIYIRDGAVNRMEAEGQCLAVRQLPDERYNQMAGKQMTAYITDNELRRLDVSGNAETLFYPDDRGELIGLNATVSSNVSLYFADRHIEHILFTTQTTGTLYPLDQIPEGQDRLAGFFWADEERPRGPQDVFRHPAPTPRTGAPAPQAVEPAAATQQAPAPPVKQKTNKRKR